jgi:hypothetical protein
MATGRTDFTEGIKTFFVVPELSVMPEDFLESFFLRGFETYFLNDDPYLDLRAKIDVLFSLFPELILFFNIERRISGVAWPDFIYRLQSAYRERALIGVLMRKQNNPELTRRLERLYLFDIGIRGGCITLEYQKAKNLGLLLNVLVANQANGRRKHLRAICGNRHRFNLFYMGMRYEGEIGDISVSHFSCVFDGKPPAMEVPETIKDIQLNLSGTICKVNGTLCVKRAIGAATAFLFIFKDRHGTDGLDPEQLAKINGFIFNSYQENVGSLVKNAFDYERSRRAVEGHP